MLAKLERDARLAKLSLVLGAGHRRANVGQRHARTSVDQQQSGRHAASRRAQHHDLSSLDGE